MSMSDPIADLLTRIRNAQMVAKTTVSVPSSKVKVAIAQVLKDEGNGLHKAGRYEDAVRGFQLYLTKYPDGPRADNAGYWLGEALGPAPMPLRVPPKWQIWPPPLLLLSPPQPSSPSPLPPPHQPPAPRPPYQQLPSPIADASWPSCSSAAGLLVASAPPEPPVRYTSG